MMVGVPASGPHPPVSAVPRRLRQLCAVLAAVVVAGMLVIGLTLPDNSVGVVEFGPVDQVAMIGIGLCLGIGILALGRSRVDADATGVRVRNLLVRHDLPWSAVRGVRFDRRSPWASLQLANGDEVSVLAVLVADKDAAVRAVEGLRALLAEATATEPARPPLLYDD